MMLLRFIMNKLLVFILNMIKGTVLHRSPLGSYCVVSASKENSLSWETKATKGTLSIDQINAVRILCGQQSLLVYGPFQAMTEGIEMPEITLVLTPSGWRKMGFIKGIKFLRNWSGNSFVNFNNKEVEVVRYRRLFVR